MSERGAERPASSPRAERTIPTLSRHGCIRILPPHFYDSDSILSPISLLEYVSPLDSTAYLVGYFIWLLVTLVVSVAIYWDAKNGENFHPLAWSLAAFFGGIVVWLLYVYIREEINPGHTDPKRPGLATDYPDDGEGEGATRGRVHGPDRPVREGDNLPPRVDSRE